MHMETILKPKNKPVACESHLIAFPSCSSLIVSYDHSCHLFMHLKCSLSLHYFFSTASFRRFMAHVSDDELVERLSAFQNNHQGHNIRHFHPFTISYKESTCIINSQRLSSPILHKGSSVTNSEISFIFY